MSRFGQIMKNLLGYFGSLLARRKRRKSDKKDDPYIYPHF
jgi:hypothetical protein